MKDTFDFLVMTNSHLIKSFFLKDGAVLHHGKIETLSIETFKVTNELSPEITSDILKQRINNHYNQRIINHFQVPFVRTVYVGKESILYLGPKISSFAHKNTKN